MAGDRVVLSLAIGLVIGAFAHQASAQQRLPTPPPQQVPPYPPPQGQYYPPPQGQYYPPPQGQYYPPPQPPPPPPEPKSASSPSADSLTRSSLVDLGLSAALGASFAHQSVQLGAPQYRSWSGGVFFYGAGIGTLLGLSARERLAINIHGGAAGLDTRAAAEIYLGPSLKLFDGATVSFYLGAQGYGMNNDELKAGLLQVPSAEIALLYDFEGVAVSLGPTAGLAVATEYVPGDEDQGRRYRRKRTSDLGAGGFFGFTWEHFAVDASFTRITAKDPIWVVDGEACIFVVSPLALCGFAQYWKSTAVIAQPGVPVAPDSALAVPTLYVGGSIALGVATASKH